MRGDVHVLRASRDVRGHELRGPRYAVVLQSDDLRLSTTLVAPTSTSSRPGSFRPEIELGGERALVMLEQLRVVDPEHRLGEFVGRVSAAELREIDRALGVVLGLR
ncbi:MAG: type II toxin-antitoxin system PemK/MazF family toxin [Microbacteriaceae bacterium]|nr:type II toxin-antitoxin system PemK/MazF family toxin [Microbacteriaceae bacterium]